MELSEVAQIVNDQIAGNWSVSNAHGVDLKACLVTPVRRDYADPINDTLKQSLWLVLEEIPDDNSGYKIVFDETTHLFGLAMEDAQRQQDIFLGFYGTFLETVEAM